MRVEPLRGLTELREACRSFPTVRSVREWKGQGGKVIGWLCTYVPEELIHAAGFLPFRVMGDPGLALRGADSYLYSSNCSFAKSCLELRIEGRYDFLDGLVAGNTCDHIRRLFDIWTHYFGDHQPLTHILDLPRKTTEEAYAFYRGELEELKGKLEAFGGVRVTDQALREAISLYNRSRALLKALYDLKKEEAPPISGGEFLEVMRAATVLPRGRFNDLLEQLLEEIGRSGRHHPGRWRLLIAGAVLDNSSFIQAIEERGGLVVADELCTGSRYFWEPVDPTREPLEALARRYLKAPTCARMPFLEERMQLLEELVQEFRVEGVICPVIKFCDTYGHDLPRMVEQIRGMGLPVLPLDIEYGGGAAVGQVQTRVEAFLEMLGARSRGRDEEEKP